MNDRLDQLLEKYWQGASSPAEEGEMKVLLEKVSGYELEKSFFLGVAEIKNMKSTLSSNSDFREIPVPEKRGFVRGWMKIAATVILLAGFGFLIQQYQVWQEKEAQAQAYFEVMEAFSLIQQNLHKGEKEMEVMDDLKYLHAPHQLFNLNERKND
ncbi:hypothetical protein SAMN05192553_103149 [Cyclobacterium xiamenense]|uniref:Uncharacterized protein n=1 Tax=Cyclobacterium xiamenense TaxID=1297121 RepID=A0A1H6Y140_9BACT|nr:hypothetical protein [Cyclobacterium xiamenense]SEJ30525.1 hypothetical protein SAMN05192553_103149 [Cyclobacterium xiamenense]